MERASTDFTISIACSVAYGVITVVNGERKRESSGKRALVSNKDMAVTPADRWNCVYTCSGDLLLFLSRTSLS